MRQFTVHGTRQSNGNEFQAPVEAEDEDDALLTFKQSVDEPGDFEISHVEEAR